MTAKTKPDPTAIYVAWQSFASADGTGAKYGERFRGDHPAVVRHYENFVPDGMPTSEWPSVLDQASVHEAQHQEREREFQQSIRYQLSEADVAVAQQDIPIGVGDVDPGDARRLKLTPLTIKKGDRFYRANPLVQTWPHLFKTQPLDDVKVSKRFGMPATATIGGREVAPND